MTFSSPRQADPVPDHAFGYPREDEWPLESDEDETGAEHN